MVEVDRAGARHSVLRRQEDLRRDVPDRGGDRGDGHFAEVLQDGAPGKQEDGAFLVGAAERVPADLASTHQSPQTCSLSQSLNSPGSTGLRA